jgi:EmrB/QacA subfamily drug resistance transporter
VRGSGWRSALALLCAADVLVTLDGTVVTVALPTIERDLQTSPAHLQWVVTAYTLTLGAFLLVGGRVGDLYGRRRTLVAGLVVFTLASGAAGFARTTELLLSARAVQGIGAALAIPAALALLMATYREERARERALGFMAATMDIGMVVGLVLGGVLTAAVGWPWCFFIVVPIGLAAAALAPVTLLESRDPDAPRLDLPGAVLAAGAFGGLAFGIAQLEHAAQLALPVIVAAVLLLATFVAVEHRSPAPMVRLAVFRHRPLTGANLAIAANAGCFGGLMFITTLYLQQVLGYSAFETGLSFVPLALSACAGGLAAPRMIAAAGSRRTAAGSMIVTATAFVLLSLASGQSRYATAVLPAFLIAGFTFAAAFVPLTAQGMTGVRDGEKGLASGLFQTSTHLGGAIVLTILASAVASRTGAVEHTGRPTPTALASGFALACLLAAALLTVGALTALWTLPRNTAASN